MTVGARAGYWEDSETRNSEPLLRVRGLRKSFGGQVVLDNLSTDIHAGEVILLRGANGSGKTTLLNILSGSLPADGGAITFLRHGREQTFNFPLSFLTSLTTSFSPEAFANAGTGRTWQDVRLFNSHTLQSNVTVAYHRQIG